MKNNKQKKHGEALKTISQERGRTNILRKYEQNALAYFVQRIPSWISSDMLTGIGFLGSILIFLGYALARYFEVSWLYLSIFGYAMNWFGDSLDGRLAYYRNKQRKWYGFSLDLTADWLGTILMGLGFIVYAKDSWELFGFCFVVLYGWEMITTLVRYKVTDKYSIDSGLLGPTEVRIVLSLILVLEIFVPGSIYYSAIIACTLLFINNISDMVNLLKLCNVRDAEENKLRAEEKEKIVQ